MRGRHGFIVWAQFAARGNIMRNVFVAAVVMLLLLLTPRGASARPIPSEPSQYGRFEMALFASSQNSQDCRVAIRRPSGAATFLFAVPMCSDGFPGVMSIGAVEHAGGLVLPSTDRGQEFHIFGIASARGGNAVTTTDYWVVVVTPDSAWTTPTPITAAEVAPARLVRGAWPVLVLDDAPSTRAAGTRYIVVLGRITNFPLPKEPSWPVSQEQRIFQGELSSGFHSDNYRPAIDSGNAHIVIDEDGPCNLGAAAGHTVRLIAQVTTWDDARTVVRCASVQVVK